MGSENNTNRKVLIAALSAISAILVAYLGYLQVRVEVEAPLHATQTAEMRKSQAEVTAFAEATSPSLPNAPKITKITEVREDVAGEVLIHKYLFFIDPDGDASLVVYKLLSTTLDVTPTIENDPILAPAEMQEKGAVVVGTWKCGVRYHNYKVVLEARILDKAGNYSDARRVEFVCP